ncbi:MAG: DUF4342 domain-containing protein [Andreesenia angusta]|nr:DUF4342 domain-containing protein [Andreesenia angusta]
MITLDKIDQLRERTGLSYAEANRLLEENEGDLIKALIAAEKVENKSDSTISSKGDEIIKKIKELIREGNVTKIQVKKDDEIIMNIPVNAGAIGFVLSPYLGAIGFTAALVAKCDIEVVKESGEIVRVNDMTDKTVNKVRETTGKTVDKVKNVFKK